MNKDFVELLQSLENCGAEYLVIGGYAVMAYAEPRFTKDLDVWVRPEQPNATRVFRALAKFGAPLEGVTPDDFATPGLVYQMGVAPVRVDVLMSVDGLQFEEAWSNRKRLDFGGVEGLLISKEDLMKNKRASGREQDLLDLKALEQTPPH